MSAIGNVYGMERFFGVSNSAQKRVNLFTEISFSRKRGVLNNLITDFLVFPDTIWI
jgi:hypothetical protein